MINNPSSGQTAVDRIERRHLEYFVAVAHAGSIKLAAEQLFVSPSSISKSIASLEAHVGTTLFERSRHGTRLTSGGHEFMGSALGTLRSFERLGGPSTGEEPIRTTLDIVCIPTLAQEPVGSLVGDFHRRHPGVRTRLNEPAGPRLSYLLDSVLMGIHEVGITEHQSSLPQELRITPLPDVDLWVVAPPGTKGFSNGVVSLDRWIEIGMVVASYWESSDIYRQLRALDPRIDGAIAVRTDHRDTFVSLAAGGAGAVLVDRQRALRATQLGCVAGRLECVKPRRIAAVWRDGYLSRAAQAFIRVCQDYAASEL